MSHTFLQVCFYSYLFIALFNLLFAFKGKYAPRKWAKELLKALTWPVVIILEVIIGREL